MTRLIDLGRRVRDEAMRGQPGGERAVHTLADYGGFRLFVTSRMNPRNGDHLGILFWGPSPGQGVYKKNIQFQSPQTPPRPGC